MATVGEIAVKYGTQGANAAVRADRKVRDSIQTTAKEAQSETGTINRWMDRHKSALKKMGIAATAAMGGLLSMSPTLRNELSGVRMAFSLLADTIVRDVLPGGASLTQMAFEIVEAYQELPGPVQTVTNHFLLLGAVLAPLVLLGVKLLPVIVGLIAVFVAVAAVALVVYGVFIILRTVFEVLSMVIFDVVIPALSELWSLLTTAATSIYSTVVESFGGAADFLRGWAQTILGYVSSAASTVRSVLTSAFWTAHGAIVSALSSAWSTVSNIFSNIQSAAATTASVVRSVFEGMGEMIAGFVADTWNAIIPAEVGLDPVTLPTVTVDAGPLGSTSVGGQTIFQGVTFDLPQLRQGGFIERGGLARLHAGERVVPAAEVGRDGGGAGGTTVIIEQGAVQVDGARSPRRTAEKTVDEISGALGSRLDSRGAGR